MGVLGTAYERDEQRVLARWLDHVAVLWCHVANERKTSARAGKALRELGVKRGVPDVLIFTPPPRVPSAVGCAVELKRKSRDARPTADQREWLANLEAVEWVSMVCHGADEAIYRLTQLGYADHWQGD